MLELNDIITARRRIASSVRHTPLLRLDALDEIAGFEVFIKPENMQDTGSFKLRGATNKLLSLSEQERKRGIIAASSGNHAQAVAAAAARLGLDALIVMPVDAPSAKVAGTLLYGAKVERFGHLSSERESRMRELAALYGRVMVHPYADDLVKAGQGTAALEILEDEPQISAIVAPIGGGGLISGLATAAKGQKPGLVMVGVEPSATPRYKQSRQAHTALTIKTKFTIADGTRGNYASPANFPLIEERVDELIDVDDDMLMAGIYAYACQAKLVAEPSGALPMAALLSGRLNFLKGQKVCLVVSGGNLDFSHYADWLITGAEIVTSYGLCPHDVTIV